MHVPASFAKINYRARKILQKVLKKIVPGALWSYFKKTTGLRLMNDDIQVVLLNEWAEQKKELSGLALQPGLTDGVNIVGFISAATGLGEAARSSIKLLDAAGIPYSLVDLDFDVPDRQRMGPEGNPLAAQEFPYQINLLHLNPNHYPVLWETFGEKKLLGRRTIGVWYWELPEIPKEWEPAFQVLDEIWAPTQFVRDAIQRKATIPVHLVPPCVEVTFDASVARKDFGLPEDAFLFLVAYDVLSSTARKNPQGAIDAFRQAFSKEDCSVGLVIKINNAEENPEGVAALEAALREYPNCHFIKKVLPREQFNALIHLIDVYVSLHRSEGFGLVAAEAMCLGKPVIMTRWSGNVDFISDDNCCPVAYHLVPVGPGNPPYDPKQLWAEPSIEEAALFMRSLKENPQLLSGISQKAAKTISDLYSSKELKYQIIERLGIQL